MNVLNYPGTFDTSQVQILQRKPDYTVPRFIAGILPFQYVVYNQLGYFTYFPSFSYDAAHSKFMSNKLTKFLLLNVYWKIVSVLFTFQFKLKRPELPRNHILHSIFRGGTILDTPKVNRLKASGQMKMVPNEEVVRYDADRKRFVLKSGAVMDRGTDVLCSATGFKKTYPYLDDETLKALGMEEDGMYLFNQILPVNVDRIAFIGSEVSSFQNVVTHFVQSEWLGHHLQRETEMDTEVMEQQIEDYKESRRCWLPSAPHRASNVQPHVVGYNNYLCRDMDSKEHEKKGFWKKWLQPYTGEDYARILPQKVRGAVHPHSVRQQLDQQDHQQPGRPVHQPKRHRPRVRPHRQSGDDSDETGTSVNI